MSAFVTETLPEDVNVLLFSQSPALADIFTDLLEQYGLQVTRKSSDVSSLSTFLDSGLSSTWYKVFWLDDVDHLSIDQSKQVIKIFQQIKGLSYVVMHQPYSYKGNANLEINGQKLIDISVFFEQRSPYTSILSYQDVLSDEFFSLNYQQIVHFLHQSRFPLTFEQLGFIKETEMLEAVVSLSFDPRGGKRRVVVSKKPLLAKKVLKSIQSEFRRRFHGEDVLLQKEVSALWSGDFKEFAISSQVTEESLVSELIVQAKFHYQPPKVEEYQASDIPKPRIPLQKPVVEKSLQQPPEPKEAPLPEKEPQPVKEKSTVQEEKNKHTLAQTTQPEKPKDTLTTAREKVVTLSKPVSEQPSVKKEPVLPQALHLPLADLVPKSIQEKSIQVTVAAPLVTQVKRPPVLIPEQPMPDIRRSKIILHQFSTSLEHHLPSEPEIKRIVPQVSPQASARVQHEQHQEQEKRQEQTVQEDHQKKLLEKKIANMFSGAMKPPAPKGLHKKQQLSAIQVLFGKDTRVGKWYTAKKGLFWFLTAVVLTTLVLVGFFFFSSSKMVHFAKQVALGFEQGSAKTQEDVKQLVFWQSALEKQLSSYSIVLGTGVFSESYAHLEVAQKLSTLSQALQVIQHSHIKTIRQVVGAVDGDPVGTLIPSLGQTDTVYKQLSLLEGELKGPESNIFFQTQLSAQQQQELIESISEVRRQVLVGQQLTEVIPNTLTKESKKTIAIVLQDAQELRATGGFVQGVALLTLTNGKISDAKMIAPDSLSEGIGGEVVPPEEVTQYLGEKNWFLRDGNWNPDFEVSAKQLQFFLEKGLNTKIDAVVGLNTNSLAKIVGALDGVTVAAYDDEHVTENNLSDRAFFYAKTSLVSTSQPISKPDFVSSVLESALNKLKTVDDAHTLKLMDAVSSQLKQAEMTLSFQDLATETTVGSLGWTGSVIKPPCPTQIVSDQCLVSRVFQIDSNVGVNKVNIAIKKKVDHMIQIKPDVITHQRIINYENSSDTNSWPGGSYKNYIRWYLPQGVRLKAVVVNDQQLSADQIKQYQDKNSLVVGAYIEVLPQTTAKVVLEYEEESIGKQASFAFFDQKQPGTGTTPTKVSIFYDSQYVPTVIAPDAKISNDKIEFSFWGGEHSFAGVKFR